ncbi:hypothetical protein VTK26DRAFT_4461 [Humicola hyalothermophila]
MRNMSSNMSKSSPVDKLFELSSASAHPYPHHCHGLALQKYLLLQEQQEYLRQHLDELRPPHQNQICSSITPSPPSSPTALSHSPDGIAPRQAHSFSLPPRRKASCSDGGADLAGLRAHHDAAALAEVAVEEAKLCDVNEGMKRALTELLNCETVRSDRAFRTWVQSRLMDTERELRSGRRRRSAPGS